MRNQEDTIVHFEGTAVASFWLGFYGWRLIDWWETTETIHAPFVDSEVRKFWYPAPVFSWYQRNEYLWKVHPCDERGEGDHQDEQNLLIKAKLSNVGQQLVEVHIPHFLFAFNVLVGLMYSLAQRVLIDCHVVVASIVQVNRRLKFLLRRHLRFKSKIAD